MSQHICPHLSELSKGEQQWQPVGPVSLATSRLPLASLPPQTHPCRDSRVRRRAAAKRHRVAPMFASRPAASYQSGSRLGSDGRGWWEPSRPPPCLQPVSALRLHAHTHCTHCCRFWRSCRRRGCRFCRGSAAPAAPSEDTSVLQCPLGKSHLTTF